MDPLNLSVLSFLLGMALTLFIVYIQSIKALLFSTFFTIVFYMCSNLNLIMSSLIDKLIPDSTLSETRKDHCDHQTKGENRSASKKSDDKVYLATLRSASKKQTLIYSNYIELEN